MSELKKGYKMTELGMIPEDWEEKRLEEIAKVSSGKRIPKGYTLTPHQTKHPYIRVSDMCALGIDITSIHFVPDEAYHFISKYRIYESDIFISVAGTLGIIGKIPKCLDGANLTENANRIHDLKCEQDYLIYYLKSPQIQNIIETIKTVGAQPKLALTRIRKFVIPLPPLPEQRAIATALSDVDALIAALEAVLTKNQARYDARAADGENAAGGLYGGVGSEAVG